MHRNNQINKYVSRFGMFGIAKGHLSCFDWACIASRLGIFQASVRHVSQRH